MYAFIILLKICSSFQANYPKVFVRACMTHSVGWNTVSSYGSFCHDNESGVRSFLYGILSSSDSIPAKSCSCESRFARFSLREHPRLQWFNRQHADRVELIVFFVA